MVRLKEIPEEKSENSWKNDFPTSKKFCETDKGILYHGDCLEIMKMIPDESVDLIVTDPPYNSKAIDWDLKDNEWQFSWLQEAKRVMKEGASLYCFFAPMNMYGVEGWIRSNLNLRNVCVWYHGNLNGAGKSYGKDRWRSTWDVLFYAVKGKRSKSGKNVSNYACRRYGRGFDVFEIPDERPKFHKAQKPLNLITRLIDVSSNEGDLVLDPFLGSGTTAIACEILNRRWVGMELEERFCKVFERRLKKLFSGFFFKPKKFEILGFDFSNI